MPDALPRPDFLQFAETLRRAAEQPDQYAQVPLMVDEVQQAERHARLLAQIQEWAKTGDDDAPWGYDSDYYSATRELKAHVRRLLEQP